MGNSSRRTQPLLGDSDYFYTGEPDTESQKSHLSSFTMKLMKFHSPKIKRTPSKKSKQLQPEPTVTTPEKPVNKKVSRLEEQEKEVVSALRYFKTIVDKMNVDTKVLQMLPGSASKVLEAILPLMQVEARIQHSSAVSSCHNCVYQSLANLIRWSDQVMLEGIDLDDKDTVTTVTTVIKAVLDGVKELVKLTIEKQEQPSPTSPNKPIPPVVKTESVCENPLTEREKAILSKTTPIVTPTDSLTDMSEEEVAPPKPPLPGVKLAEHRKRMQLCSDPVAGQRRATAMETPPALPPKKRQSAPSPTRVAVVAPMSRVPCGLNLPPGALRQQQEFDVDLLQRRFSGGSQSYGGDSPRLSPCNSMGKLSKSDEQLSSLERDSGQCSRNTSCETLEGYDPDYDFLHQDLSVSEPLPFPTGTGSSLSPLPECHGESQSLSPAQAPAHPRFSAPVTNQASLEYWTPPLTPGQTNSVLPPALPQKKRRSAPIITAYPLYERLPSHYDNLSEEEQPTPPFPLLMPASLLPQVNGGDDLSRCTDADSPPPLPEKKGKQILQYMQFVEDYSEPQPSVFYQTPQNESIYEQRRNKRFQEVYGFNDSYSSSDSVHEPVPPPALPPKQRQLASYTSSPPSSSSSSFSILPPPAGLPEEAEPALGLSLSVSNSFLSGHASLTTPVSESVDEGGEGEYVNLYSSTQANGENTHRTDPSSCDDVLQDHTPHIPTSNSKEALSKDRPKEPSHGQINDVDELSLIDHNDIMNRITLKAENDDGPDVRAGSGDILLVHATETDRKDLVLYCEAFLTTYRTFITPEDLIKKLHYRYTRFCHSPDTFRKRVSKNTFFVLVRVVDELCLVELTEDILRQLMDLVFRLVCNGELSLARVLRKNILDKVEQKRLLRHMHMLKPLAARGVSARPGTLHDFRSHEIADQLTLLDAELFYKIEIPEVLLWAKEQNEEKSPNLTQFTEHFNNMSYWVRSIIIQQEKAQDREKLLLKFIKIMKHLRKLNNFNSYLAILSALDSAPIRRLEWQKQTSEGLEEYCTLIDSSSSFRAYRAALAEVEPPCIPYLGLILQDLTFVHLGNPDFIDGKVNFSKRWQQFNILDSMRRFQQVHYELKRNEDIVSFFNDFSDHLAEEALWELSLKIKPRNISRRRTEREEKT
ncbi:rap guanine nucleotide exchange factor 1b isoform X5 [Sinocyclocheilus rhinocerous]|uniref:rap guanine nucleotide exchange factor 1b isoform X5 n=1 Tax=Sinocyclocheilus rhinocerous TaxID=307959 RepID=UPI0007B9B4D2|nr:PREDICTED: rap guanine nucleotide exchange factor 1-like isoform X5 [Sinocyclocheilus rhinocerous]